MPNQLKRAGFWLHLPRHAVAQKARVQRAHAHAPGMIRTASTCRTSCSAQACLLMIRRGFSFTDARLRSQARLVPHSWAEQARGTEEIVWRHDWARRSCHCRDRSVAARGRHMAACRHAPCGLGQPGGPGADIRRGCSGHSGGGASAHLCPCDRWLVITPSDMDHKKYSRVSKSK